MCCLQETHIRFKDRNGFKVKGWRKICHANSNQKTARVAILMSDKRNFRQELFLETNKDIL